MTVLIKECGAFLQPSLVHHSVHAEIKLAKSQLTQEKRSRLGSGPRVSRQRAENDSQYSVSKSAVAAVKKSSHWLRLTSGTSDVNTDSSPAPCTGSQGHFRCHWRWFGWGLQDLH